MRHAWTVGFFAEIASAPIFIPGNVQVARVTLIDFPKLSNNLSVLAEEIDDIRSIEVDEHTPTESALDDAGTFLRATAKLIANPPVGETDFYYGELGIEWRVANQILRITFFGNSRMPRLDYGEMSVDTPGIYGSETLATPELLASRLRLLSVASTASHVNIVI